MTSGLGPRSFFLCQHSADNSATLLWLVYYKEMVSQYYFPIITLSNQHYGIQVRIIEKRQKGV